MVKRKVLIIAQDGPVPLNRRVWLEARTLRDAGYLVSVICPSALERSEKAPSCGDPGYQDLEGVHLYKYSPPPVAHGFFSFAYEFLYCWFRTAWLALHVWRNHGIDVIQACNPPDTLFALAAPFKLLGKRFIFDQHDLCPELYMSRFDKTSEPLLWGLHLLEQCTYNTADHVISTNESYRQIAITQGHKQPKDVTVVRTGPDPDRLKRLKRVEPSAPLKHGRAHLACYLGVMGPQDGVDYALRAFDVLVHKFGREDCHLALIGKGDVFEDLRRLCHELNLDEYVTFTGRIPDDELFAYLATSDVGLSPDPKNPLNDVSTMNKTVEYMTFGLPVVAFDLRETKISAADAALYASPNDVEDFADKLSSLLDDPDRRAKMGAAGRARVENVLAWEYQVPALLSAYASVLA